MTVGAPSWGTTPGASAWQLAGAAYRLLHAHGRAAVNLSAGLTVTAIISTSLFSWLATGNIFWDQPPGQDLTVEAAFWMIAYGVSYLWISGLIFERWTRHLLGAKKPVRDDQPTFWPSWLLAFLVISVVFIVVMTITGFVLAPTRSLGLVIGVSMPLAWVVANLAGAQLLLKSSVRAGHLALRPGVLGLVRQDWSRSGWAYAIAPLPILFGSMLVRKISEAIGGWLVVPLFLLEPVSGTITTLLIAGIGVAAIQAVMSSLPSSNQPSPPLPAP